MKEFKDIFTDLRNKSGLSQKDIAKELNISQSTIGMWETGKRFPSPEKYEEIADYFNIDIDYLYGRTDIKRKIMFDENGDEYERIAENMSLMIDNKYLLEIIDKSKNLSEHRIKELIRYIDYLTKRTDD